MPDAATSVARICLRCESRLLLRPNSSQIPPGRLFTVTRRLSSKESSIFTGQHGEESSKPAEIPRLTRYPRRNIYGPRGQKIQEDVASLAAVSLGTPSEIVVLRDANLDDREGRKKPHLDNSVEKGKGNEYASAQTLFESINAEKHFLVAEAVKTNLELLRPETDEALLSRAECDELANQVRAGFTSAQLAQYMHDIDNAGTLPSGRDASHHSIPPHKPRVKAALIGQAKLKLEGASVLVSAAPLPTLDNSRRLPRKDELVSRLLRDYWKIQIKEDIESIGEWELEVPPLEMSLLLVDEGKLLKDVAERRRTKLDVFRSRGTIRVTGDKKRASAALSDIRAVLSQVRCVEVDLRPFRVSDGGSQVESQLTKGSALQYISQMTSTKIAIQNKGNTLAFYTLGHDSTPLFDARRLFLTQLHMPSQYQEQKLCERDSSIEKAVLTSIGPTNDLAWYERGISWSRLQSPVSKAKGDKDSQSAGVGSLNGDQEKLAQSIHGFFGKMKGIRAPQRDITVHTEEYPSPRVDVAVGFMESKEQEAKWETVTDSQTAAIVGYVLHQSEEPSLVQSTIERGQVNNRSFSHNVPGLFRSISSLPALQKTITSETFLIHLRPSPWSSQNSKSFPTIEILIPIDPSTKRNLFQEVRAIISHQISDLALPDKQADLRFRRQTSIRLQNSEHSPAIKSFLAQSHLDLRSQDRLMTPPSLTLSIPRWTISSDTATPSQEEEGEVEMEYLLSAVSHRQTLPLCVNGWKAQYNSIEAGKAGGRRREFQIVMERASGKEDRFDASGLGTSSLGEGGESSSESNFKHFFNTALDFVSGLNR